MKLLSVNLKRLSSAYLTFSLAPLLLSFCAVCFAVDEDRLWMPLKYQSYYLPLKEAAAAAEALERCTEVIEATIDVTQTKPDHPIFRILCRQANRRSYVEIVDGLTMKTLTTQEYSPLVTMQRKAEKFAQLCKKQLLEETVLMDDFKLLDEELPKAQSITESAATFLFNFNAVGGQGEALKYRASCIVDSEEQARLKIRPRRE